MIACCSLKTRLSLKNVGLIPILIAEDPVRSRIHRHGRALRIVVAWVAVIAMTAVVIAGAGCAGPGPRLLPEPMRIETSGCDSSASNDPLHGNDPLQQNGRLVWYDTNRDGKADYAERLGPDGRIIGLRYMTADGCEEIDLQAIPAEGKRDLVLILDSVPFDLVQEAWDAGSFRFFPRPSRVIAPFPVMTDVSLIDFFHLTPGIAIEADYYDGKCKTEPYDLYLREVVSTWHSKVDYYLPHKSHSTAYFMDQMQSFNQELRAIQDGFEQSTTPIYIGYCVGTSALGAFHGWQGHREGLAQVDRFCRAIMYHTHGRVRITMFSDHGHNSVGASQRIPLRNILRQWHYHVGSMLKNPMDVIVPEFAMVSCAAMYTQSPKPFAEAVLKIENVELSAYSESGNDREPGGSVVVESCNGKARIHRSAAGYRYEMITGDPLYLRPILEDLQAEGKMCPAGFVPDDVLLAATQQHVFPDAVDRIWRAFYEQFQHPPDVLLTTLEGHHCGSEFQTWAVGKLQSVHGNLRPISTFGFVISTAGELPPILRMRDLSTTLVKMGIKVLR